MRAVLLLVAACLLGIGAAKAETKAVPDDWAEVQLSLAPVARSVAPSVVNVVGVSEAASRRNPYKAAFYDRYFPGEKARAIPRSVGSGVILDASGVVVTNNHVIEDLTEIRVRLADRRELPARAVLRDPRTDLAVLEIEGDGPFAALALRSSDELEVGDLVVAVGHPMGLGQTVTRGIVSGLARTEVDATDSQSFIQTDAAINPGNSGGALVDVRGRLVGINTAIFSLSGGSDGVGFAIPADLVRVALDAARAGHARMRRPWLGARLQAPRPGSPARPGALIRSVAAEGPAAAAGLREGDLVVAVDGRAVDSPEAFNYRLWLKGVTGTVPLTLKRGAETLTVRLPLAAAPELRPRDLVRLGGDSPLSGATAANGSPAVADELGLRLDPDAIVLMEVSRGSRAQRLGFRRGDAVVAVDGQKVRSSQELDALLRRKTGARTVTLRRDGRTFTRAYSLDQTTAVASGD